MQTASLAQLKTDLQAMPHPELLAVCLRMVKYKKENKELLTYLIYESGSEATFIADLKLEVDDLFETVNTHSLFWAKKTIRKIGRHITKHSKFSGIATTQIEWLIHFCEKLRSLNIVLDNSPALVNLYLQQLKKIEKLIQTLHEDLQYDYRIRLSGLVLNKPH
jgi:hypothetical protein